MAQIFDQLAQNKQAIIDAVVTVLQSVPDEHDYTQDIRRIEDDLSSIQAKKDRLLEMSIEGVISTAEFKQRNDGFNQPMPLGLPKNVRGAQIDICRKVRTEVMPGGHIGKTRTTNRRRWLRQKNS